MSFRTWAFSFATPAAASVVSLTYLKALKPRKSTKPLWQRYAPATASELNSHKIIFVLKRAMQNGVVFLICGTHNFISKWTPELNSIIRIHFVLPTPTTRNKILQFSLCIWLGHFATEVLNLSEIFPLNEIRACEEEKRLEQDSTILLGHSVIWYQPMYGDTVYILAYPWLIS